MFEPTPASRSSPTSANLHGSWLSFLGSCEVRPIAASALLALAKLFEFKKPSCVTAAVQEIASVMCAALASESSIQVAL
jgi:hypothetical protein